MNRVDDRKWNVRELLEWTTRYFADRGITTARLDGEVLLAHALATDRIGLYLTYESVVPADTLESYRSLVRRRSKREPVAYITGEKEFYGLPLRVTPDVLVPRPETEILVENVVNRVRKSERGQRCRALDVGTGSGAVAVAVAKELASEDAAVVATDISEAALAVARWNAERNGVASRVEFRHGDLLSVVQSGETFTAVLSNLPYIPTCDFGSLEPEVAEFEPRLALDGGEDGLELIRALVDAVPTIVRPNGWLALEIGVGQAERVVDRIRQTAAFKEPTVIRDYSGVERVVLAQKKVEGEGNLG
jgi:release factor glutamine methyltransferase